MLYVWEIDNFVIKSDIFREFFNSKKIFLIKLLSYQLYFKYFMHVRKIQWFSPRAGNNGFVSKARVFARYCYVFS
jgi:hypothetical protein